MITEKLSIFNIPQDQAAVNRVCKILKNGGTVAIPTETVYGLAANTFDEAAVAKIFTAKGRPQDNPLIVHVSDMEMLKQVAESVPEKAQMCAEAFWPGPFTMVLPRGKKIPASVSAGLDTVAVRMPSNKIAHEIIKTSGLPLAAPSANLSGSPSPTTAEHVIKDLDGKIDAIVLSEKADVGIESTVVTFCTDPPRLLRPGGITVEMLKKYIPELVIDKAVLSEPEKGKPVASPGMKYKHYSPKARIIIIDGTQEQFNDYVNKNAGEGVYALTFEGEQKGLSVPSFYYGKEHDGASQAAALFGALRMLDEKGCKLCYARAPEKDGVGLAVYNRLIRAAAFTVIKL